MTDLSTEYFTADVVNKTYIASLIAVSYHVYVMLFSLIVFHDTFESVVGLFFALAIYLVVF